MLTSEKQLQGAVVGATLGAEFADGALDGLADGEADGFAEGLALGDGVLPGPTVGELPSPQETVHPEIVVPEDWTKTMTYPV